MSENIMFADQQNGSGDEIQSYDRYHIYVLIALVFCVLAFNLVLCSRYIRTKKKRSQHRKLVPEIFPLLPQPSENDDPFSNDSVIVANDLEARTSSNSSKSRQECLKCLQANICAESLSLVSITECTSSPQFEEYVAIDGCDSTIATAEPLEYTTSLPLLPSDAQRQNDWPRSEASIPSCTSFEKESSNEQDYLSSAPGSTVKNELQWDFITEKAEFERRQSMKQQEVLENRDRCSDLCSNENDSISPVSSFAAKNELEGDFAEPVVPRRSKIIYISEAEFERRQLMKKHKKYMNGKLNSNKNDYTSSKTSVRVQIISEADFEKRRSTRKQQNT